MTSWNDFYEKYTEEIIKTTKLDGNIIISTVKSLPGDSMFGIYHTAITVGRDARNIAEGYWEKDDAATGHELFIGMSFDELFNYKCVEYCHDRSEPSKTVKCSATSLEGLEEMQRGRIAIEGNY